MMNGKTALPVADFSDMKTGRRQFCPMSGTEAENTPLKSYGSTGAEAVGRSMMISVKDPRFYRRHGGIVQGMSGTDYPKRQTSAQ